MHFRIERILQGGFGGVIAKELGSTGTGWSMGIRHYGIPLAID
jgi:hypothetical protein